MCPRSSERWQHAWTTSCAPPRCVRVRVRVRVRVKVGVGVGARVRVKGMDSQLRAAEV